MTTTNKQTAAIWAEKLGDAYVGCYGLMDDIRREKDGINVSTGYAFVYWNKRKSSGKDFAF